MLDYLLLERRERCVGNETHGAMVVDVLDALTFGDGVGGIEHLEDVEHGPGMPLGYAAADHHAVVDRIDAGLAIEAHALRERVCDDKLIGAAQEFSDDEMDDPILRGIDKDDPIARNPCLRRGPLSLDYWIRLPGQLWRSTRALAGVK